jgi:spore germination cell wall hydrolase CwlJ-like protein
MVPPSELDTLARTIWGESRGEPIMGQAGVAWVVMNRVRAAHADKAHFGWWGDSVQRVCLSPSQFSCWLFSDPNLDKMKAAHIGQASFARAFGIACLVVAGDIADPTADSTHYYAATIPAPKWTEGMSPRATIGNHHFFREPSWS